MYIYDRPLDLREEVRNCSRPIDASMSAADEGK
jgi:hypothetical protein